MWDPDKKGYKYHGNKSSKHPDFYKDSLLPDVAKLLAVENFYCLRCAKDKLMVGQALYLINIIKKEGWGNVNPSLDLPVDFDDEVKRIMRTGFFMEDGAWQKFNLHSMMWRASDEEKEVLANQSIFLGWDGIKARERVENWMKDNMMPVSGSTK